MAERDLQKAVEGLERKVSLLQLMLARAVGMDKAPLPLLRFLTQTSFHLGMAIRAYKSDIARATDAETRKRLSASLVDCEMWREITKWMGAEAAKPKEARNG